MQGIHERLEKTNMYANNFLSCATDVGQVRGYQANNSRCSQPAKVTVGVLHRFQQLMR